MQTKLRVFLCHASQDKPAVRELYKRLKSETWIDPWLDEENLIGGQDFDFVINKATRDTDAIIICLSKVSVVKEGYVNKEIRRALDIADEKPEGTIYVIPLRLDECDPSFEKLKKLHWVDYFTPNAHERLIKSLRFRAEALEIQVFETAVSFQPTTHRIEDLDLYEIIQIPQTKEVPYSFYISKYPVTNAHYERFLNSPDFPNPVYWLEIPKIDENGQLVGDWGRTGLDWLREQQKESKSQKIVPLHWEDKNFGSLNPWHPVVGISWYEASAYCEWLLQNWGTLLEGELNPSVHPKIIRLPLGIERIISAGGDKPNGRYPWDKAGQTTTSLKEILRCANIKESEIGHTTSVNAYPLGRSPFGVMDMSGNVLEWQANYENKREDWLGRRGGSWFHYQSFARVSYCSYGPPGTRCEFIGFRVVLIPK